ncbi:MAG: aminoglycoside phosphotransferase family protein [Anaerolineales bacterium]|nr:aminoglycoside phosphotransferase family protein [Anaerolineales bacterium]
MDEQAIPGQKNLREPSPWPFDTGEIMAGLRRLTGDPQLAVLEIGDYEIPHQHPSVGQVRGLRVVCSASDGDQTFHLVLKEPLGTTRVGTAGVGLREVNVYRNLTPQLPLRLPRLVASHPAGDWLVLELTATGEDPQNWSAEQYRTAIQSLVILHDRFWGLGQDLTVYNWLSRPLTADFDIYLQAARAGVEQIASNRPAALLDWDASFPDTLEKLVAHAAEIARALQRTPFTLLHGDYWPGNLQFNEQGQLVVYDWQKAGIGPATLDIVRFIQASRWWFDPLPLPADEMVAHYRSSLAEANNLTWSEAEWQAEWDNSLLWTFITGWIDLLAATPESLLETRRIELEEIWLNPLRDAATRQRIPGL